MRSRAVAALLGQELRLCRALAGQAAVALHNARLFSSVHAAQAETALLRERLQRLTCELAGLNELPASPQTLPALSEAVRAAFEAHSCVIARRGRVLGAAVEAGQGSASPARDEHAEQHAYVVGDADGDLELTLVARSPAAPGQAELLGLMATLAAKLASR